MSNWLKLKYCPRTTRDCTIQPLNAPVKRCRWNSKKMPGHDHEGECCYWTTKGLLKYCEEQGIIGTDLFGTRCLCVLYDEIIPKKEGETLRFRHDRDYENAFKIGRKFAGTDKKEGE